MLKPISKNYEGLITISGPTKSGKSQLAEFLIKEQESITYIATSKPRKNDPEWSSRISAHKKRRPVNWKLIEYPIDICETIKNLDDNESILIDSLGGLVEQHIMKTQSQWELFQDKFLYSLKLNKLAIFIVTEEVGWGIVPSTEIGHIFRERLCNISSLVSSNSNKKWLAVNGMAIDLDQIGHEII
tara:strand:- start:6771 stop:7328 length:558 start_codon:yes stop_codon:yes gene_type:complete